MLCKINLLAQDCILPLSQYSRKLCPSFCWLRNSAFYPAQLPCKRCPRFYQNNLLSFLTGTWVLIIKSSYCKLLYHSLKTKSHKNKSKNFLKAPNRLWSLQNGKSEILKQLTYYMLFLKWSQGLGFNLQGAHTLHIWEDTGSPMLWVRP